ncbi:3-methyladenine DNA glycosylase [Defluviimonas sp. 20V17]|uniref:DNA-3-methyladenine glycosylase II n=1 Tax=Allgaiera indica TaxID=765699 RepID=A0A1H2TK95_9RHOB|nr:DNA-3-methyladenine glycosylase [Allgaiera indica]KDB03672.1 3-methyladenine DNA glycosylase [Defluviimonas sp. 20V17]SDW43704.1 DNA-3-methyladenine glycosylase II [Allgaiera indica]
MGIGRIIESAACVTEGLDWLVTREPRFAAAMAVAGEVPLRRRPDGFGALVDAIVAQQVSVASARAIGGRLRAAGLEQAEAIAGAGDEALRACGLSRPKMRYLRALAAAGLDFDALRSLPDREVVATLVAVPGIGRWTAEVYAMLALGRADVFAPGDLALQEAARGIFGFEARPSEAELRAMADAWSPWRGVAARLMWAYYARVRQREGIT